MLTVVRDLVDVQSRIATTIQLHANNATEVQMLQARLQALLETQADLEQRVLPGAAVIKNEMSAGAVAALQEYEDALKQSISAGQRMMEVHDGLREAYETQKGALEDSRDILIGILRGMLDED